MWLWISGIDDWFPMPSESNNPVVTQIWRTGVVLRGWTTTISVGLEGLISRRTTKRLGANWQSRWYLCSLLLFSSSIALLGFIITFDISQKNDPKLFDPSLEQEYLAIPHRLQSLFPYLPSRIGSILDDHLQINAARYYFLQRTPYLFLSSPPCPKTRCHKPSL